MSRWYPSKLEIDIMSWMYQNKGYHEPVVIATLIGLEPPTVRRMLGVLLKADFVMAKPTLKGNKYRTTKSRFENFLKRKRQEIKRCKETIQR